MQYFKAGSIALIIISISHLAGHFLLVPHFQLIHNYTGLMPANGTEKELLTLMNHYHRRIGGSPMSMMDIQQGLSLCYSLFFFWMGVLNLTVYRTLRRTRGLIGRLAFLNAGMLAVGTIICAIYFFWLPVFSFGIAAILFGIASRAKD